MSLHPVSPKALPVVALIAFVATLTLTTICSGATPLLAHEAALGPNLATQGADAPDPTGRLGCRFDTAIPEGAIFGELDPTTGLTPFSPRVETLVDRMTLEAFDSYVRDLSGESTVSVGGQSYDFVTRYSLVPLGQICWQYAYEQLEALGYDVRYQEYTRSGHDLKNIIATLPGEATPEKIYVIGGHLDSTSEDAANLAPGAEDNGSGSSAVLAAAAALAGERFESTIEFVLFTGEEQGLWGSQAYVSEAVTQGRDVRAAVTMDMISYVNNDYGVLIEGGHEWSALMEVMGDAVDQYTTVDRQFSYFSFGSDHVPFQNAGIPAILAIDLDWGEYPYYHRTTDTYDKLTVDLGLQIGKAALASVVHLAGPLGQTSDTVETSIPFQPGRLQVTPNPAFSGVEILYGSEPIRTGAEIFDVRGRRVQTLQHPEGTVLTWDLRNDSGQRVAPGLYWLRTPFAVGRLVVLP